MKSSGNSCVYKIHWSILKTRDSIWWILILPAKLPNTRLYALQTVINEAINISQLILESSWNFDTNPAAKSYPIFLNWKFETILQYLFSIYLLVRKYIRIKNL